MSRRIKSLQCINAKYVKHQEENAKLKCVLNVNISFTNNASIRKHKFKIQKYLSVNCAKSNLWQLK